MRTKLYQTWLNWRSQNWKGIPWSWWIALVLGVIIIAQLSFRGDWSLWWQSMKEATATPSSLWYLGTAILLMPLNWLLETVKWQIFLRTYWQSTWKDAFKAVLAGISVSLATPNRIGEYGGRMLILPPRYAGAVIISTLAGSISQWIVFILCGWPSTIYVLSKQFLWIENWFWPLALLGPVVLLLGILLWSQFSYLLWEWKINSPWWRWFRRKIVRIRQITLRQYVLGTFIALFRFAVFVTQYYCLLHFFGFQLNWLIGVTGICSIFFIQAGLPLPPGIGVLTRTELAILLWGNMVTHPAAIVSATITLFIINLVIPALPGTWMIVRMNRKQQKEVRRETVR